MSFREKVSGLVDLHLQNTEGLFLIDLKVSPSNDVTIVIDGDRNIGIQDCLNLSRALEKALEEMQEDQFSLQVTSYGIYEPLLFPVQYTKNLGRDLEVLLTDGAKFQGKLLKADAEKMVLESKYRRAKLIGKGKETVTEETEIAYTDIKRALLVIKI